MKLQKILITGSHGLLGSILSNILSDKFKIISLHRDKKSLVNCFQDFRCDLIDYKKISHIVNDVKPNIIIHTAALVNIDICEKNRVLSRKLNYEITKYFSDLSNKHIKIIFISSDQVYGDIEFKNEKNYILKPLNYYGIDKLDSENYIRNQNKDYINIRTNFFGRNIKKDKSSFAEWIINSIENKQTINLYNDYIYTPISSFDLANYIVNLINLDFIGTINIGSQNKCSKYEFALELIKKISGNFNLLKSVSFNTKIFHANRSKDISLEISKLRSLKLIPINFEQSIANFLNYDYR